MPLLLQSTHPGGSRFAWCLPTIGRLALTTLAAFLFKLSVITFSARNEKRPPLLPLTNAGWAAYLTETMRFC